MKNKDLYEVRDILERWSDYQGVISYSVMKNIELVDTLLNTFNNFKLLSSLDYENEKKRLNEEYSGDDFNREMDDLDYNIIKTVQIMESDCNIQFHKVKQEHLPNDISANELKEISFMVD